MVVKNHFTVRSSAKVDGYYIDYLGNYSIQALKDHLNIKEKLIKRYINLIIDITLLFFLQPFLLLYLYML